MTSQYSILVVGGGHAGCEAALAAARRGFRTLLITGNIDQIGAMSCNPAIGGLGKGHLVKEIDALGGEMGKNTDATGIQFRKLNLKKGPAVQGTRAQADKYLYKTRLRFTLESQKNLFIKQGLVERIWIENQIVKGVILKSGERFLTKTVILTTGTFLRGLCHIGDQNFPGGRAGDEPANSLSLSLKDECGLRLMRLKTGTVPRLDGKTIHYKGLEEQWGDDPIPLFSFSPPTTIQKQICCHITYTNPQTHDIIRRDLQKSAIFSGNIKGVGPRYCPSIEDKIVRFADKERHQIFLEPEGLMTREVYPNGLSTSLPLATQIEFLRTISGLENVEITRAGYAVEYDAACPTQLTPTLETKNIKNLFLAGQINGTTGYEEAAAQGFLAGINATLKLEEQEPLVFKRSQAYLGVLIDDLVTKGVGGEPYRMFTSRAEYRLHLREDNADVRLRELGRRLRLVSDEDYERFENKIVTMADFKATAARTELTPKHKVLKKLKMIFPKTLPEVINLAQLCKWPEFNMTILAQIWDDLELVHPFEPLILETALTDIKYQGYQDRYQREIKKMDHYAEIKIPRQLAYDQIKSLSSEVREKLQKVQPITLAQALGIPGITPAAASHIEIYLAKQKLSA